MFEDEGYRVVPSLVSSEACDRLIRAVSAGVGSGPGSRNLLALEPVARTADALRKHASLRTLIGHGYRAVQCSLFAKGSGASWSVAPHQDLSIPVRDRVDAAGWSGWSRKEGTWFVQPPVSVLEQLIAVRLQLDDHSAETGPLEVVPGSHVNGRLASADTARHASRKRIKCIVPRGGALVMRPLLIHASAKPASVKDRRVLHYLYGPPLPSGLAWAAAPAQPE